MWDNSCLGLWFTDRAYRFPVRFQISHLSDKSTCSVAVPTKRWRCRYLSMCHWYSPSWWWRHGN